MSPPRKRRPEPEPFAELAEAAAEGAEAVADWAAGLAGRPKRGKNRAARRKGGSAGIPQSLRSAAGRKAGPRGRAPSQRLVDAAAAGVLTKGNTKSGSAGRRAVDAATYRARAAKAKPGQTAREAVGHEKAGLPERSMSTIIVGSGYVTLGGLNGSEVRRTARYASLCGELVAGEITPKAFRRRVGSWGEIRGERFQSDPDVVTAIIENRRALGEEIFEYLGRRT